MPEVAWINASGGSPEYNAQELRRITGAWLYPGVSDRFGARQGARPTGGVALSMSGTTWQTSDLQLVVYPGLTSGSGPYVAEVAADSGTINPADGSNPRIDAIDVQVRDDDEDSSGEQDVRIVYVAGTPASSPSAPSATTNAVRVGTILVPAGGSPSPSVDEFGPRTVAVGGILPLWDDETAPSSGVYEGAYVDKEEALVRRTDSSWIPVASPNAPTIVTFTTSGSFVKASYPWAHKVVVEVVGGGGGGGGASQTTSGEASAGAGGSGGGYSRKAIAFADLSSSETVTVGSGGLGGSASSSGDDGGSSSFGAHCSATGGNGGNGNTASSGSSFPSGGLAGSGSGGDLNVDGSDGGNGYRASGEVFWAGTGGGTVLGGYRRGAGLTQGGNGQDGNDFGGGGSGGHNRESQGTDRNGGDGADGVVVVTVH